MPLAGGDRTRGVQVLQTYWNESGLAAQGKPFSELLSYYDRLQVNVVEQVGGAANDSHLPQDQIQTAMQNLAAGYGTEYPWYGDFFNALSGQRLELRHIVADAIAETAGQVAAAATIGFSGYLLFLALPVIVIVFAELEKVKVAGRRLKNA